MPRVDFPGGITAEIKVSGKSVTDAPPTTLPVGPRSFAPPPVVPINLTVVAAEMLDMSELGSVGLVVTFDAPPHLLSLPNWIEAADVHKDVACVRPDHPNAVVFLVNSGDATEFTVPVGATGVYSATGGIVNPGTFPLPFPPP